MYTSILKVNISNIYVHVYTDNHIHLHLLSLLRYKINMYTVSNITKYMWVFISPRCHWGIVVQALFAGVPNI